MVFTVFEESDGRWLVAPVDCEDGAMDARFTGECARDRAYAYMHWLNDPEGTRERLQQLRAEIDHWREEVRNLRAQIFPLERA